MTAIKLGDRLMARTAYGYEVPAMALSEVEVKGHSFPCVWVRLESAPGSRIPWPVEALRHADWVSTSTNEDGEGDDA